VSLGLQKKEMGLWSISTQGALRKCLDAVTCMELVLSSFPKKHQDQRTRGLLGQGHTLFLLPKALACLKIL